MNYLYDLLRGKFEPSDEGNIWEDEPTRTGVFIYSVIVPIICILAICLNGMSMVVLRKGGLKGSSFLYLQVLATSDFFTSIVLLLGGLSKGAMWWNGWGTYDALVGIPLASFLNSIGVLAVVGLTIDRVVYLWNPVQLKKPKFCRRRVARRIVGINILISVLFNLPYCFIFDWNEEDDLAPTPFYNSRFYEAYNWIYIIFIAIFPSIILILGNGYLIYFLRRAKKITERCKKNKFRKAKERSIIITLISMIISFLISEIPANLVSRTSAVSLLFSGDHSQANSKTMEYIREVCYLISAVNVTVNFLLFYLFCPSFSTAFKKLFKHKRSRRQSRVQLNVFVINNKAGFDYDHKGPLHMLPTKLYEIAGKKLDGDMLPPFTEYDMRNQFSDKESDTKKSSESEDYTNCN